MGHCPKRWEGVQTGSQIFHIVQMGHREVGCGGPDGNVPNAAHKILFNRRLITNILINVVILLIVCLCLVLIKGQ